MASQVVPGKVEGDKYRSFLDDEAHTTQWRHGGPPIYDAVNKLFEQGRTKVHHLYISILVSNIYTYIVYPFIHLYILKGKY